MNTEITTYNEAASATDAAICNRLMQIIDTGMDGAEAKVWHGHPVWFLDGNPIVGYSVHKENVCLLFWSGQTFSAEGLEPSGSFKAAEARYTEVAQIDEAQITAWLRQAHDIQWDYKNIVKRKGTLIRLK